MTVCTQCGLKCLCLTDSSSRERRAAGRNQACSDARSVCYNSTNTLGRWQALPTTVVQIYQRAHGKRKHGLPVMARTRGVVDDDGGFGGDVMVVERESRSQTALL